MNLTDEEAELIFSIMRDLSGEFDHAEVRRRVGQKMLDLLKADYFASYVWDDDTKTFVSCVQINMTDDNLRHYENYFQFHDPITPTLQRRKKATPVSEVMRHERLVKTEFFNDFSQDTETWSAFASLTWNITDAFRTTVGIRYSDDNKDADKRTFAP